MSAARQIATRMIDELPEEMIVSVISYIAFIRKENAAQIFD